MLLWMIFQFGDSEQMIPAALNHPSQYLAIRIAAAGLTALLTTLITGSWAIRVLQRGCRERIASDSARLNELQSAKHGTPTMGGLFFMAAALGATLLWSDLFNSYVLLGLFVMVSFTGLGALDDWIKLRTSKNGLSARQKFAGQLLIGGLAGMVLYAVNRDQPHGTSLLLPFFRNAPDLGVWFAIWAMLVMVASSNAVNLTDGLDGLAAGCAIFSCIAFTGLTYACGNPAWVNELAIPFVDGGAEFAVVVAALTGALLGFLKFNLFPAKVFMGDAGALPIGALLALAALVCRQEVLLILIGGVFVLETLSVILQVACFKLTGRRVIRCSPLHNHFLFVGVPEVRIVTRFWISSAVLAAVGLISLKIRW